MRLYELVKVKYMPTIKKKKLAWEGKKNKNQAQLEKYGNYNKQKRKDY